MVVAAAVAATVVVVAAAASVVVAAVAVVAAAVVATAVAAAAVVVVAADKAHTEGALPDARASASQDRAVAEGTQPNVKRPAIFAEGTNPSPKVYAEGTQLDAPAFRPHRNSSRERRDRQEV